MEAVSEQAVAEAHQRRVSVLYFCLLSMVRVRRRRPRAPRPAACILRQLHFGISMQPYILEHAYLLVAFHLTYASNI